MATRIVSEGLFHRFIAESILFSSWKVTQKKQQN